MSGWSGEDNNVPEATSVAKSISEIVGEASSVGKSRVTVYQALKQLICAKCGELHGAWTDGTSASLHQ